MRHYGHFKGIKRMWMDRAILSVLSEMTGENVFQVPTGMLTVSFFSQRSRLMRNCTVE